MTDFLVIGAGLAGVALSRDLVAAGASVAVIDKGRVPGGRAATRALRAAPPTIVDHGAQFFTARTPRFAALVEQGLAAGWIREWSPGFPLWRAGGIVDRAPGHARYCCPAGMSVLPAFLAGEVPVATGRPVTRLVRADGGFQAFTDEGAPVAGRRLVLNLPPVQLRALVGTLLTADEDAALAAVTMEPAWAVIARLERDLAVDWPAVEFEGHPSLAWAARDHTRRAPGAPPTLVVHASGAWSAAHLEDDPESVGDALIAAVQDALGVFVIWERRVHRWRYAKPADALGRPHFLSHDGAIGACGDWCEGGRVEGAVTSGWSLAAALR